MLFGYTAAEMIGGPIEVLIPPQGRDEEAQLRARVARGLGVEHYETVRVRKDGTRGRRLRHPVADRGRRRQDRRDRHHLPGRHGRKRAEAKFQGLLESAPDAIVVVGADGLIRLVNRQTEVLFGYDAVGAAGPAGGAADAGSAAPPVTPASGAGFFANPSVRAMGANLELAARRKDGSEFPVDISLSPLETEEGVLVSAAVPRRHRAQAGREPRSWSGRSSWRRPGTRPWRRPASSRSSSPT